MLHRVMNEFQDRFPGTPGLERIDLRAPEGQGIDLVQTQKGHADWLFCTRNTASSVENQIAVGISRTRPILDPLSSGPFDSVHVGQQSSESTSC